MDFLLPSLVNKRKQKKQNFLLAHFLAPLAAGPGHLQGYNSRIKKNSSISSKRRGIGPTTDTFFHFENIDVADTVGIFHFSPTSR